MTGVQTCALPISLREENFYLTEGKRPVLQQKLIGAASNNKIEDLTIIIDRSKESAAYGAQIQNAVRELSSAMKGEGTLRIVCAGAVPATEYKGSPRAAEKFGINVLKTPVSAEVPLDLALRLAANDLINAEAKRAVVFLSAGRVTQNAFKKYGLSELTAYFNNNSIAFSPVLLTQGAVDPEIAYLQRDRKSVV